jgi:hypothetical protein
VLEVWVGNTLEPDLGTLDADLKAWNNCYNAQGDSPIGCESYGSDLASDATSAESDPRAPVASVQSAWSAVLSDSVNEGTNLSNDDMTDANTVSNQLVTDLKSLEAALAANGITNA